MQLYSELIQHSHQHINVHTRGRNNVLQQVIDDFRKGLLGRGSPVWVKLHWHIQEWAPSACTHKSHSHTHGNTLLYSLRHVILFLSCCLLYNVFPLAAVTVSGRRGGGAGRRAQSQGEQSESGTSAQRALCSFRLGVPLWASMGLFLTATITTNNWTANEDKWYDCRARPSSQSAI